MFISVSRWCKVVQLNKETRNYDLITIKEAQFGRGRYSVTVENHYVYIGSPKCWETFCLSTRLVQIVFDPATEKTINIPFRVPEEKGRRKKTKAAAFPNGLQEFTARTNETTFIFQKKFLSLSYKTELCCVTSGHQSLLLHFLRVECNHVFCFICKTYTSI